MIISEAEAKKLWCPFARVLWDGGAFNRGTEGQPARDARCLGSGCMAWVPEPRWGTTDGFCGLTRSNP